MTHLSTENTNYGQEKGRKSKCQFDSPPLKVGNRSEIHACGWCNTYRWKALDENYNFFLDLTLIKGLHNKLWASKVPEVIISIILGLSTQEPRKNDFWMQPIWLIIENTIMRKVVAFLKFDPWWVLWIRACAWLVHAPSMH